MAIQQMPPKNYHLRLMMISDQKDGLITCGLCMRCKKHFLCHFDTVHRNSGMSTSKVANMKLFYDNTVQLHLCLTLMRPFLVLVLFKVSLTNIAVVLSYL